MPVIVYCKECAKKIRAPDHLAGQRGQCPRCHAWVAVPEQDETAPPPNEKRHAPEAPGAAAALDAPGSAGAALHAASTPAGKEPAPPPEAPSPSGPAARKTALSAQAPAAATAPSRPEPPEGKPEAERKPEPYDLSEELASAAASVKTARRDVPKPVRIRLGKPEAAPAAGPAVRSQAASPKVELRPTKGEIHWDTAPDPPPNRAPWILALLAGALLFGGGWGAYYLLTRPAPPTPLEERRRRQFQVERKEDVWDRLRKAAGIESAPGGKTGPGPRKSKRPPALREKRPPRAAPAPAGASGRAE